MMRLLFVHALTPIHCGTGLALGAVDLPVARDRSTGMPLIPGSSLKGALRAKARDKDPENVIAVFGPETRNASEHSGALVIGDAYLLLLPVRSVAGTFAYATSPLLLRRFARDLREAGLGEINVPAIASASACVVVQESALRVASKVLLEDFDFTPSYTGDSLAATLGELLFTDIEDRELFRRRLCVVHDDAMSYLAEHATQVDARVSLDPDTKTVKQGALWYEESLPTETVLVSVCAGVRHGKASPAQAFATLENLAADSVQLGGKATVGRGRCRLVLAGGAA
jgi:CRISPR-associated protein Cmr4